MLGMFRLRRYRVFIVFAVIVIGLFYHFRSIGELQDAGTASVEGLKHFGQKVETVAKKSKEDTVSEANDRFNGPVLAASSSSTGTIISTSLLSKGTGSPESRKPITPASGASKDATPRNKTDTSHTQVKEDTKKGTPSKGSVAPTQPSRTHPGKATSEDDSVEDVADTPKSGVEPGKEPSEETDDTAIPRIHWSQLPEHFPVPTESLIPLPTGEVLSIPKIQHDFSSEKDESKLAQKDKLEAIKDSFAFSWAGYKDKAWMHDELSPKSGKYRNPFCGWGATMIDSLDTLWLMDMKEEFDDALEALKKVDFTTSMRNDIPLFETVIRYLGGLVGAYDISGGKHKIILDKAVELAEILMGAFDTPNRMPMTFYLWKPTFASQPHRAKTRVVLAELGTLSLEFTRLAQITKEDRYYDAIARITNEFEIWQNQTLLPGLWPLKADASGCKKVSKGFQSVGSANLQDEQSLAPVDKPVKKISADKTPAEHPVSKPKGQSDGTKDKDADQSESPVVQNSGKKRPRTGSEEDALDPQLSPASDSKKRAARERRDVVDSALAMSTESSHISGGQSDCEPQGLVSPPSGGTEEFSLGGLADSAYEYLPKEFLLLGGLEAKYRTLYETAADVAKKHLIYRPMIPDEKRNILQSGLLKVTGKAGSTPKFNFEPEGTHLTCFVGGMLAVGAKIFGRSEDLDFGKRLTDGCIWAYESTNTGIMPESYFSIACESLDSCPWNETLWHEKLDPYGAQREKQRLMKQQDQDERTLNEDDTDEGLSPLGPSSQPAKSNQDTSAKSGKEVESVGKGRKGPKSEANDDNEKALTENTTESESLETKLFSDKDTAEEEPLPKHGKSKLKSDDEDDTVKRPLLKRQLGEVEEKPLRAGPKPDLVKGKDPSKGEEAPESEEKTGPTKSTTTKGTSKPDDHLTKAEKAKNKDLDSADSTKAGTSKDDSPESVGSAKPKANKHRPIGDDNKGKGSISTAAGIPTREEFVAEKIKNERLPIGMTKVTNARYHLR